MIKSKTTGAVLNLFIPGLGNFYARKISKAIITYISFTVVVLSVRFFAYDFTLFVTTVSLIVLFCVFLVISGYHDVKKDKEYEPVAFDKLYVYVLISIFHWVLIASIQGRPLDAISAITFARITTPAMDPGLKTGDVMAVKKTKAIERNDIVTFWFPDSSNGMFISPKTMYVKRCIGLPGDSLQIKNAGVWINGSPLSEDQLRLRYSVTTDGSPISKKVLDKVELNDDDYMEIGSDRYEMFLLAGQVQSLKDMKFLKSVEPWAAVEGDHDPMIYPKSDNIDWNSDFYGPLYIPKRGDQVRLTNDNIDLYIKYIDFENGNVERDTSGVRINGQLTTTYQFKDNYFFMMGDSRHNSLDSRYWGFVPEKLVIGKGIYLFWAEESERIGNIEYKNQ